MRNKYTKNFEKLFYDIDNGRYTLVEKPRFETIDFMADSIYAEKINGDIVECGVWRGGMSIYLSYVFPDRKIWVCDSFEGFQNPSEANYDFPTERHNPNWDQNYGIDTMYNKPSTPNVQGLIKVSLEEVKENFKNFGLGGDKDIEFVKGWVRDTMAPDICPIEKIALLRIDVDAYSATMEVLDGLYDKVVSGGWIIFDDSPLTEVIACIKEFKRKRGIDFTLSYPKNLLSYPKRLEDGWGGYFRKK